MNETIAVGSDGLEDGGPRGIDVVICTPTVARPYPQYLESLERSAKALDAMGITHKCVFTVQNPYISVARATMMRKALDAKAQHIIFIDHDLSWEPQDLLKLISTEGEVVAGTYRFKKPAEEYMGEVLNNPLTGRPIVRRDGAVKANRVPAGFLMLTAAAVDRFMTAYPQLCYGPKYAPTVDLFNHGAHKGTWYGEDYAFSRNWIDCGGEIWLVPNLNLTHHTSVESFPGNFHRYLCRLPKGSESECPEQEAA